MPTLPKNVSKNLNKDIIDTIYNYDNTYKKMYDKVMYNFYWDIFQTNVLSKSVMRGKMNLIAYGGYDMAEIYKNKNDKLYVSHIMNSLWVN